jgi:diguanylate cyclase (GGDEF)-like protein
MKKRRPSARINVLLPTLGLILLLLSLPTYFTYKNMENLIIRQLGHNATSTAIAVARFLERDVDAYRAFHDAQVYEPGSYDETWYRQTRAVLGEIKQEINADFIFTEKWIDEDTIAYLLDAEEPGSEDYSPPGSEDGMSDPERKAFTEGISTDSGMIRDPEWGDYLTGFAPIHDHATGNTLGLVGVDYAMSHVQDIISGVRRVTIGGMIIIALLASWTILRLIDMRYYALEIDYLTGVYSKHYHDRLMTRLQKHAEQTTVSYCHAIMDIDNFKQINDAYTHQDGDEVLKSVALIVRDSIRASDCCARLGGDEFGFLFPDTRQEDAMHILERIRLRVATAGLSAANGDDITVTLSIGMVEWRPGMTCNNMETLADNAMYQSKNTGKNKVSVHELAPAHA